MTTETMLHNIVEGVTSAAGSKKRIKAYKEFGEYLLSHEDDIASGINDFAYLESVFIELLGRKPEKMTIKCST